MGDSDAGGAGADGGPSSDVLPDGGSEGDGGAIVQRCRGKTGTAGDAVWTLTHDGVERRFRVHVPASYDATKPTALVLNFHGFTSDALQQELLSRMPTVSDENGFIAVAPEGVNATELGKADSSPLARSWNAGACCGAAVQNDVDDVGFVRKVLDALDAKLCVDRRRVYATGMSNGGFFSYRLACELADRIAAFAPVAGVNGLGAGCNPSRPVPLMHFHGTLDGLVPYNGGGATGFAAVPATVKAWAAKNGCAATAAESYKKGDVTCVTYDACTPSTATATLCTVTNGGHTWPGGMPVPALGYTTTNIDASREMWKFFKERSLPVAP